MIITQKNKKNIVTILAIITIISAVLLSCVYIFMNVFGLTQKDITTENLRTISSEVEKIVSLKIDISSTNLIIQSGNEFKVETNNTRISFNNNNGSIKIIEKSGSSFYNAYSDLIVYIPDDITIIDEINIESGAGKVNIESLNARDLYLKIGSGDSHIENVKITQEAEIIGGIGKTEFKSCEINNLVGSFGVGKFTFSGKMIGRSEIDSGIGAIDLYLIGNEQEYSIDVSKGIGNIIFNGNKIYKDGKYGNGANSLDIDGGSGEIKINFTQ